MTDDDAEYEEILNGFRREFRSQCAQRIEALDARWAAACQPDCTRETLYEFQRALHSLVGTGRTLGYADVSTTARAAEDLVEPYCDQSGEQGGAQCVLPADVRDEMNRLLEAVRLSLTAICE